MGDKRDDGRYLKINLLGGGFPEENKTKGGHQKCAILRGEKILCLLITGFLKKKNVERDGIEGGPFKQIIKRKQMMGKKKYMRAKCRILREISSKRNLFHIQKSSEMKKLLYLNIRRKETHSPTYDKFNANVVIFEVIWA